jgi:hypothetical protein
MPSYPYVPSAGPLTSTIQQLRKNFPSKVDTNTLRSLSLAKSNEGYVINTLRFLKLIDEEGAKRVDATVFFLAHDDHEFQAGLEPQVKESYKDLFDSLGDEAWTTDRGRLITFFRQKDGTSQTVGERQASTFLTLAALCGQGVVVAKTKQGSETRRASTRPGNGDRPTGASPDRNINAGSDAQKNDSQGASEGSSAFALTVRIEVNLPASDDQAVYDKIFKSIRENLINGK